jgi:hypothetical protein
VTQAGAFGPRAFVESAPWRFAKTMPQMSHEYVVEGNVPDDQFWAFVSHIRERGFEAYWHGRVNTYLELGGWRYWAMPGRGEPSVTIINRERLPDQPLRRPS